MFSGNTEDWIVQIPAASDDQISAPSNAAPTPRRGPAENLPGGSVGSHVPVARQPRRVKRVPRRGHGFKAGLPGIQAGLVYGEHLSGVPREHGPDQQAFHAARLYREGIGLVGHGSPPQDANQRATTVPLRI